LKGVAIDFGDTLAYIDETGNKESLKALFSMMSRFGYQGTLESLVSTWDDVIWNSMKGQLKNMKEFWTQFTKKLNTKADPVLIENLEAIRIHHSSTVFKLYERALSVLSTLRDKYQLALVSNCAIGTSDIIEALNLKPYFKCIVLSYEVGVRKPHEKMYLDTLQCLGLGADQCIFVADEISDLEGATEVGMKTILVRQGKHTFHEAKDQKFQPDFQCNRISEITKFL
jgi:HAD superfamily hydrolase (TIGR01509 family)